MKFGLGSGSGHAWRFFLAGGLKQVRFESAEDYRKLAELDQKLWVALSMPTRGIEFDPRTLDLIDADKDGRIRPPELLAAVEHACALLKDPASLRQQASSLPLAAIDEGKPAGKAVAASARQILVNLGKANATEISIEDVSDTARIFSQTQFNGDGVIVEASLRSAEAKALFADIATCQGTVVDRSGAAGIDKDRVDAFFTELASWDAWWKQGEAVAASLPLGEQTADGDAALQAVRTKIDDYFARCQLAAYDARAAAHLNRADSEYVGIAARDLSAFGADIAAMPLAKVEAGRDLPLVSGINPAWSAAVSQFRSLVVSPLLGADKQSLSQTEWQSIQAKFQGFEGWLGSKPGSKAGSLGKEKVRAHLVSGVRSQLDAAIAEDLKLKAEAEGIDSVSKLVRYHRDLHRLLENYVNFADFYDPRELAVFQAGTLYLDSRSCELCIEVADAGAHSGMGALAKFFIAYCECTRPGQPKRTIAALFTQGDSDFLMVGRNGVFYDRKGLDWDAKITKIVDNPVSIRQAFWSPYKKFVRMIEEQIAKRASAAESASDAKLAEAANATANADKSAPAAPKKFDLAVVTGIGVALGSIGTFMAAIFAQVVTLKWWQYPLVLVGLMLVISLPSMILAWLKLRQRTLGPVLDANGWAINGRVKVNIPLGSTMTHLGHLPSGAVLDPTDPFAEKRSPWPRILLVFVALLVAYVVLARSRGDLPLPEILKPAAGDTAPEAPAPAAPAP